MKTTVMMTAASALAMAAMATSAAAGGFQLNERSSKALGASLSGATSAASDISFAAYNPAALSAVEHVEAVQMVSFVSPIAEGTVASTGEEVDADQAALVPGGAIAWRTHPEFAIGVVAYSPFGLVTDHDDWEGSRDAETSRLTTVSISPTAAWNITPGIALGASVNILIADSRLTNSAVDLQGNTTDTSFSVGTLLKPTSTTQIGMAYHQGYDLQLVGENKINALNGTPFSPDGSPVFDTEADASLPNWASLGITQEVSDDWRLMGEARWIGWSDFEAIDVRTPDADFSGVGGPDLSLITEEQNYRNSLFFAVGTEYDVNDKLTLRGGVAWDETPTSDGNRTARVPDSDRLWLSAGASYDVLNWASVDASYSYLHSLEDVTVELEEADTTVEYDGGAHILSVGGTFRF